MSNPPVPVQTVPLTVQPPSLEEFATGNPALPVVWPPYQESDFLTLVQNLLPQNYWYPMLTTGDGWEVFQALGAIFGLSSAALSETWNALYILTATGAQYSTVIVAFSRANANAGPVTVLQGTVVQTSGGLQYVTQEDVQFGETDVGPLNISAQATYPGTAWNLPGPYQTAAGELVPGPINEIQLPYQNPPFADPTITVAQVSPATGGVNANLDALGIDRGMPRNPGETDDQYRTRLRTFRDQISPVAITAAVQKYLAPYLVQAVFEEPWDTGIFGFWDASTNRVPNSDYDPSLSYWDAPDSSELWPVRARWLTAATQAQYFLFGVPNLPAIMDFGGYWDDPEEDLTQCATPIGTRSVAYWDASPPTTPPVTPGLPYPVSVWDGEDYAKNSVYAGLVQMIALIKAAGISFDVVVPFSEEEPEPAYEPIGITPSAVSLLENAGAQFAAYGGNMIYSWALTHNASGGTIDALTGAYTAGSTAGQDTITVTDGVGNTAKVYATVRAVIPT